MTSMAAQRRVRVRHRRGARRRHRLARVRPRAGGRLPAGAALAAAKLVRHGARPHNLGAPARGALLRPGAGARRPVWISLGLHLGGRAACPGMRGVRRRRPRQRQRRGAGPRCGVRRCSCACSTGARRCRCQEAAASPASRGGARPGGGAPVPLVPRRVLLASVRARGRGGARRAPRPAPAVLRAPQHGGAV